jgi:ComF family protein
LTKLDLIVIIFNMLRLFEGLVDLVYPKICLACKNKLGVAAIDNLICRQCWNKVKRNLPPFCHCCGRNLRTAGFTKNICLGCLRKKLHFDRAYSPCVYEGVIKELIHAFKYSGKDYLGLPLSRLMNDFIREYNLPINDMDFIVPVPLHKTRLREREFNQAQILSQYISREFKKEVLSDCLYRHRHTKPQAELEINERTLNVAGSFSVSSNDNLKGKNIILVDDVFTTGATVSEAASVLKGAGVNIVFVLTLAN